MAAMLIACGGGFAAGNTVEVLDPLDQVGITLVDNNHGFTSEVRAGSLRYESLPITAPHIWNSATDMRSSSGASLTACTPQ
jgi:NADH dehydrogenase FAD-containing subunit